MKQEEMVKAAVIGFAVADAVGVPTEFLPREKLMADPITDMIGYGSHDMPKGTWSDDTSMLLCTLQSMVVKHGIDLEDIMTKFARWIDEGWMTPHGEVFGVGRTCMRSIRRWEQDHDIRTCGGTGENDNGNGSLMRIIPICLYNCFRHASPVQAAELVHRVSALTHAHPRSCMACGIYDIVLRALVEKPAKETVYEALQAASKRYAEKEEWEKYARLFRPDFADTPLTEISSSGYVVATLEASIWCLLNTQNYRDCVLLAANLGEDTDTVAAIAGGLAGILYGYDAIPTDWIDALAKKDMLLALCEAFAAQY